MAAGPRLTTTAGTSLASKQNATTCPFADVRTHLAPIKAADPDASIRKSS